jgi:glycosyltransferase involved in cell wall biosynthesis
MAVLTTAERIPGLVSVIMPFLNPPETFLREAVQSIEDQTYADWELLLVDDGSATPLSGVATRIADARPHRVRYIEHEGHCNLGISASRNRGISAARGEYIAFLDADDLWDRAQIEEQVHLLEQHPEAAMLYGNTLYWHTWAGNPDAAAQDVRFDLGVSVNCVVEPPAILRLILTRRAVPPCMTAMMVRSQVFDEGIDFEESFPVHYEDQVFVAKMASQYPVYVSDRTWGKYRQHGESVTAAGDDTETALAWRLKYLQWMTAYLREAGIEDRMLRFLLWLETGMLRNRGIDVGARFYRLWRGRFRRLFASPRNR